MSDEDIHEDEPLTFSQELQNLLNKHSMENVSGTPDWILMEYLRKQLEIWDACILMRADWRGESTELPALQKLHEGKHNVPLTTYVNGGQKNDIGEAEIKLWPGEAFKGALVTRVIPVFEYDPDNQHRYDPSTIMEQPVGSPSIKGDAAEVDGAT